MQAKQPLRRQGHGCIRSAKKQSGSEAKRCCNNRVLGRSSARVCAASFIGFEALRNESRRKRMCLTLV